MNSRLQTARERAGWEGERAREVYLAQLMELRMWLKAGRMDLPWAHLTEVVSEWKPKGGHRARRRDGVRTEFHWTQDPTPRQEDGHDQRVEAHRQDIRKQVLADDKVQRSRDHVRMVWRDSKGRALRLDSQFRPYYQRLEKPKGLKKAEVDREVKRREEGSQYWAPAQYDPSQAPQTVKSGKADKRTNCGDREWIRQCGVFGSKI